MNHVIMHLQNSAGEGGIGPSQEDASEEEKEGEKVLSISKLALDVGADSFVSPFICTE